MVSKLSAAGVIETLRGTGGGLRLARPPATINLADIIEAVEGPIAMTTCLEQGRAECCIEENCRVKPHWGIVNDAVRGALAEVSLASLSSFPDTGRNSVTGQPLEIGRASCRERVWQYV